MLKTENFVHSDLSEWTIIIHQRRTL